MNSKSSNVGVDQRAIPPCHSPQDKQHLRCLRNLVQFV